MPGFTKTSKLLGHRPPNLPPPTSTTKRGPPPSRCCHSSRLRSFGARMAEQGQHQGNGFPHANVDNVSWEPLKYSRVAGGSALACVSEPVKCQFLHGLRLHGNIQKLRLLICTRSPLAKTPSREFNATGHVCSKFSNRHSGVCGSFLHLFPSFKWEVLSQWTWMLSPFSDNCVNSCLV